MAAFRQHATFGFWKHALVIGEGAPRDGMGSFGKMRGIKDLPDKRTLLKHIRKAMKLNEHGVKIVGVRKTTAAKSQLKMPADFASALALNAAALEAFEAFPQSHRREYLEWISQAKREETKQRRIEQAIEMLSKGKPRNWKYMKKVRARQRLVEKANTA
jgi:Bacteriocin-protection, YdeI or OmpD-Associated